MLLLFSSAWTPPSMSVTRESKRLAIKPWRATERRIVGIDMQLGNGITPSPPQNPLPDATFEVRTSTDPVRGQGLFATAPIEAGCYLMDYVGEVILENSSEGMARTLLSDYSVGVRNTAGVGFIVDAMDPRASNLARYMNHAATGSPECNTILLEQDAAAANQAYAATLRQRVAAQAAAGGEAVDMDTLIRELLENPEAIPPPRLHLFATRSIEVGMELMFDYGEAFWENMAKRGGCAPS